MAFTTFSLVGNGLLLILIFGLVRREGFAWMRLGGGDSSPSPPPRRRVRGRSNIFTMRERRPPI
jgi:hypothetical protein